MRSKNLDRLTSIFYALATGESLPSNSKDLATILKNIEELENYNSRKKYAEKNLKHLSSGSSRLVYLTPGKTVIKMAKNDRGIAQNKAEANSKMKSKHLNKILSQAKNHSWIEVPYLEKITEKDFEKMAGFSFEDFGQAIRYGLKTISGNSDKEKPKNFNEVSKSSLYKDLVKIGKQFKLMPGDLVRISSWGCKNDIPILIDAGLTKDVYDTFYDSSS